jgi:hypothetical protein
MGRPDHQQGVHACQGGPVCVVILPAVVAARQGPGLVGRSPGHLLPPRPPGRGGNPPLCLEVRLAAVAAVVLDGLSCRRAGRMVGISKTEVGDSLDLLVGPLAALGYCQPDGTFVTTLADLRQWLVEMARAGEAVCVDGLATRVQLCLACASAGVDKGSSVRDPWPGTGR